MNINLFKRPVIICVTCILAVFVGSPVASEPFSPDKVSKFVKNKLPAVRGEVVSGGETIYVSYETEQSVDRYPVVIYREELTGSGKQRSLNRSRVGTGDFRRLNSQLGVLEVTAKTGSALKQGDRFHERPGSLWIHDPKNVLSDGTAQKLGELESIESVYQKQAPEQSSSERPSFELAVTADQIELRKVGQTGVIGTLKSKAESPPAESQTSSSRSVSVLGSFNKPIVTFRNFSLPQKKGITVLALASKQKVGFAYWKGDLKSQSWHAVRGEVLDITALSGRMGSLEYLPLLVVTRREGSIRTHFYYFDLQSRDLSLQWTENHVWLTQINGEMYGVKIGLSSPFKRSPTGVKVDKQGWDWQKQASEPYIPRNTIPSALRIVGGRVYRINGQGKLEVYRGSNNTITSTSKYGGNPIMISGRRQDRGGVERHPGFVVWELNKGTRNIVVANNVMKGYPLFKSLQSYDSSRLYLLEENNSMLKTRWESKRLPGYISHISSAGETIWATVVSPSNGTTKMYKVRGVEVSSSQ
ncbi:MAG: hypothetical protein ABEJ65_00680 [bacterium]